MKLSNFRLTKTKGTNPLDWEFFAEVDVTTGMFFWKKTTTKQIYKKYGCHWIFLESGEYTPNYQVEKLATVFCALNDTVC